MTDTTKTKEPRLTTRRLEAMIPNMIGEVVAPMFEKFASQIGEQLANLIPAANIEVEAPVEEPFVPPFGLTAEQWEEIAQSFDGNEYDVEDDEEPEPPPDPVWMQLGYKDVAAWNATPHPLQVKLASGLIGQTIPSPDPNKAVEVEGSGPFQQLMRCDATTVNLKKYSKAEIEKFMEVNRLKVGQQVEWGNRIRSLWHDSNRGYGTNRYDWGKWDAKSRIRAFTRKANDGTPTKYGNVPTTLDDGAILVEYVPLRKINPRTGNKYRPPGFLKLVAHTPKRRPAAKK